MSSKDDDGFAADTLFDADPDNSRAQVSMELEVVDAEIPAHQIAAYIQRLSTAGFRVQGVVARGGMATIEKVVDPSLRRRVARKTLHRGLRDSDRALSSFVREAHITGQLDHPNVVPVHELATTDGTDVYFTMKLVEGRTFEEVVLDLPEGDLPRATLFDLIGMVIKVCDALALAHSRGVIHCDIKPANIMVGNYGQVYLMDWGIARLVTGRADGADAITEVPVTSWVQEMPARGLSGTPAYMAPEHAAEQDVDTRADVFAVGALLYFMLARRPPYTGRTAIEVIRKAYGADYPPLDLTAATRVPRGLEQIVRKAMAREAVDRYPTIGELKQALLSFMRGEGSFPTLSCRAGDLVVLEGEEADAAYIVVSGQVEVYREREGQRASVALLGPGEVFGETGILASTVRTANVEAVEDSVLRVIHREAFEQELEDMVPWMGQFIRALAQRFRKMMVEDGG